MKLLLSAPRFERVLPWVEDFLFDFCALAASKGHAILRLPAKVQHHLFIDKARERACREGIAAGADVVLMTDSDCCISAEEAVTLAEECLAGDWTMLTAPIPIRGSGAPNWCLPPWPFRVEMTPEEAALYLAAVRERKALRVYGFAGTGVCALTLARVKDLGETGWWDRMKPLPSQDPARPPGVDVSFSRRAIDAGGSVGVHLGLRSGRHWDLAAHTAEGMLVGVEKALVEMVEGKA